MENIESKECEIEMEKYIIKEKSNDNFNIGMCDILKGQVALITGGGSGIGFAIAERFMKAGCKCIIAGRDNDKLIRARSQLSKYGVDRIQRSIIDISKITDIEQHIRDAAALFGDNRIDILVNNASVRMTSHFGGVSEEEYDAVMNTNAKGTFFMTQAMGNYMIRNQIKGHIVNISSSAALLPAYTPYRMSKWAVKGFTLGAARMLLPYGIIVNAIAPGPTMTEMMGKAESDSCYDEKIPSKRYSLPDEIAALALYLVSGFADQIIGETININGGEGTLTIH